jgi:hypothetical protein
MLLQSIIIAIGFERSLRAVGTIFLSILEQLRLQEKSSTAASKTLLTVLTLSMFGAVGFRSVTQYLEAARQEHNPFSFIARRLAQIPPRSVICSVPHDQFRITEWEIRFLALGREFRELNGVPFKDAIDKCGLDSAVWAVSSAQEELRQLLQHRYPLGTFTDFKNGQGKVVFSTFQVGGPVT